MDGSLPASRRTPTTRAMINGMAVRSPSQSASAAFDLRSARGAEATFLPGDPARTGQLALWCPDSDLPGVDDQLQLVLAAGSRVRRRTVAIRRVDLHDVLDQLLHLPSDAPVGGSLRAWAIATRLAVELVGTGPAHPRHDCERRRRMATGPAGPRRPVPAAATGRRPSAVGPRHRPRIGFTAAGSLTRGHGGGVRRRHRRPVAPDGGGVDRRGPRHLRGRTGWIRGRPVSVVRRSRFRPGRHDRHPPIGSPSRDRWCIRGRAHAAERGGSQPGRVGRRTVGGTRRRPRPVQ